MVGESQWVTNQLLKNQRLVAKVALSACCQHLKLNGKPTPLADWNRLFCFFFRKKCILIGAHYFCWHKTTWRILFLILHSKVVGKGANKDQCKYFLYGSLPLPCPADPASCEGFSNFSFISFRPWFRFRGLFGSSKFSKPSLMVGHLKSKWTICRVYCWWKKSCTRWYGKYPIIYRVSYIPGGAGILPSTVSLQKNTLIYFTGMKPASVVDNIHMSPIAKVLVRWWVWFECFAAFESSQLSRQTRTLQFTNLKKPKKRTIPS